MLPREAYVDDAVLAWERDLLLRQGWVCVGRADDLAEQGSATGLSPSATKA